MMAYGLGDEKMPREALYDVILDPDERNNLAGCAEYESRLQFMREKLRMHMETTKDPLLQGAVPMPKGARINRRDGIHPGDAYFEKN